MFEAYFQLSKKLYEATDLHDSLEPTSTEEASRLGKIKGMLDNLIHQVEILEQCKLDEESEIKFWGEFYSQEEAQLEAKKIVDRYYTHRI